MASESDKTFPELQDFWDAYCLVFARKGIDMPQLVQLWVTEKRKSLSKWSAEEIFDELCLAGCSAISLAIAISILERSQHAAEIWRTTVGTARRRDQVVGAFLKAADALEEVNENFITALLQDLRVSLDKDLRSVLGEDPTSQNTPLIFAKWPSNAPAPHPATVVKALRLYARVLGMFDAISEETQAHSAESFPKYLISAYVHRATGSFHDREVSTLIARAICRPTYDAIAHGMWRKRNCKKLEKAFSFPAELLVGVGVVTSQKA
jgi:hypothetical protein